MPDKIPAAVAEPAHLSGLASCYTTVDEEQDALRSAAGLVQRSHFGRLRFDGADALDLLNRLSTNDLEELTPGRAMHTVLTSNKGRVLDLLLVIRLAEHLLVVTSPQRADAVAEHVDFFNFGEDASIVDQTGDTAMTGVSGPKATDVVEAAAGAALPSSELYEVAQVSIGGVSALVVRTDFLRTTGYEIIAAKNDSESLERSLLAAGASVGMRAVGAQAFEAVRVRQGVPAYGRELSEGRNPHEARLGDYISLTKGCYVGQEVVIRLHTYQKVQRYLMGLVWSPADAVAQGDSLFAGGRNVGEVTSAAADGHSGRGIGLGYVRKAHVEPGTLLNVNGPDGGVRAEVVETPIRT